jgi:TPR repeat protein
VSTAAKANESARAYLQKASDLGYPQAQAILGTFYAIGRDGLARNDTEALRLSRLVRSDTDWAAGACRHPPRQYRTVFGASLAQGKERVKARPGSVKYRLRKRPGIHLDERAADAGAHIAPKKQAESKCLSYYLEL